MPYTAETAPDYVPRSKAEHWSSVFNGVYHSSLGDGDKSRDEAEARAFQVANSMLSDRSKSLAPGDYVVFSNEKGTRMRGQIVRPIQSEAKGDAMGTDDAEPLVEVQLYHPARDGWEAGEDKVQMKLADLIKTEAHPAPSRPTRKAEEFDLEEETIKAIIKRSIDSLVTLPKGGKQSIKRLAPDRIGGYGLVFGSPDERDVEGDFFVKDTDLFLDVYANQPIFFDHTVGVEIPEDPSLPDEAQEMPRRYKLGHVIKAVKDDVGVWMEAVIDAHEEWVEGVWKLIDQGVLHFSSGSVPHLIRRSEDGEVKSWPIIELSLTPSPAEPRKTDVMRIKPTPAPVRAGRGTSNGKSAYATLEPSLNAVKHSKGGGTHTMKKHEQQKRLSALLTAYADDDLKVAVRNFKAAARNLKQDQPDPDQAEDVATAASQLEELINPIADQAKAALGIDGGELVKHLIKMALTRYGGAGKDGDMPDDENEDYLEDGEFPDDEDEDYLEDGDFPDDESEDYLEDGDFPDDESEDYLEDGDLPPFDDEEEPAMMSYRNPSRRKSAQRKSAPRNFADDRAIERAVRREMSHFSGQPAGFATKGIQIMTRTFDKNRSLTAFLKAAKANDLYRLRQYGKASESHYKALGINPDTAGGYLVPPEQADQIIELLRAKSVFMRAQGGPEAQADNLITILPLNRDTLTIPKQTGAATAYWTGENSALTASQQTVGQIQLIAKKLTVLVKVSNELLADATEDVDTFIRGDISREMALKVDYTALYGSGINNEPRGIYNVPDVTKTSLSSNPADYDDLVDTVSRLEESNVEEDDSWKWLLHPRDKNGFRKIQDGDGQYIFAAGALTAAQGGVPQDLLGYSWMTTTQVARSGTAPNDETDVFLARWRDLIFGMRKTIEIQASDVAGTSFETDQTWIRAIMRMDIQVRHAESFQILTHVRPNVSA